MKQPAALPQPAAAPPQELEQPQPSTTAGLTGLQGPKRPTKPELRKSAVRKPSRPERQAPLSAVAQVPLREKTAGLGPLGHAQAVAEEGQEPADEKQEESKAAMEENKVAEVKIESAEEKSDTADEESEAAPPGTLLALEQPSLKKHTMSV